jgi:hypothetical protein
MATGASLDVGAGAEGLPIGCGVVEAVSSA